MVSMMKLKKLLGLNRRQVGFTLIELLVGLAITGLIVGAISSAIYQVIHVNASDSSRMTAVKQLETAVDTIRQDALVAQKTDIPDSSTLVLTRVNWADNIVYSITYRISNNNLMRDESINGAPATSRVVAYYVDGFSPSKDPSSSKITVVISATVNSIKPVTETRTIDIFPRTAAS
jgi:prepilin-type N-terminal cleavage/methylation domain-containing protein